MSGDALRVTTAHLAELASKQGRAAAATRWAAYAVDGVDTAIRSTHGSIASATADAIATVVSTRRDAGTSMAVISEDLSHKLVDAARRYKEVDEAARDALEGRVR
jgi:hypothetical protein